MITVCGRMYLTSSVVCRPLTGDVTKWTSAAIILKKHLWCNNWLGIAMDQFMDLYRRVCLDDYGESKMKQRSKKRSAVRVGADLPRSTIENMVSQCFENSTN